MKKSQLKALIREVVGEVFNSPRPPKNDIDWAISVEKSIKPDEMATYLEYMNNKKMSQRTSNQELRDGCILTGLFVRSHREHTS
jgi:hypothetical protein